ncbi:MAG: hypothetical protein KKC51_05705 [Verrucomicrobia bacterium]|nr:hypothetical protein [Verrucomicrobiota bacterium]
MKAKAVLTVLLLGFVAVSIAVVIFREAAPSAPAAPADVAAAEGSTLIVYYFHGNMRCATCKSIEAYTREAVEGGFAKELEAGQIEIRVVNVDEPGNEHFVHDYQLSTRSVVLSKQVAGRQAEWNTLDRVWELVGQKPAFLDYVKGEMNSMLGSGAP